MPLKTIKAWGLRTLSFLADKLRRTPLARSALLNRMHGGLTLWFHGSKDAKVGEFTVRVDPRDRFIARKLAMGAGYEQRDIDFLCSLVKRGDCAFDIGANIGLYTLHLSRAVGPEGRVIAAEPDPDNLALLKANVENNGCTNVTILPYALGDSEGQMDLYQVEDNRGYLSFADLGATGQSRKVEVRRADVLLAGLNVRPDVAKIDVEGAEPLVFSGMGDYKPPVMLLEFVPDHLRALDNDPVEFLEQLVGEGYTLETIDPDSGERIEHEPAAILQYVESDVSKEYNVLARR